MVSSQPLVLIVDDETPIRRFLRLSLAGEGYRVAEAGTAAAALELIASQRPDVVLLDLGLPDRDGLELTKEVREWSPVPIVVLSARGKEADKVSALEAGADDYVTKPFGVGELIARLKVALRHASSAGAQEGEAVFTAGELRVDLARRQVFIAGREVRLTPIEYRLLAALVKHAGKVLTHRQLLHEVWGPEYGDENHYVRVYVAQLRRKLEADPARPRYLRTEPGVGYRLIAD
ncbi:MAG TPA: response regulator [Thermoanaerobaculaceae bacterium]|nr:response regulator [Thermoanaerobaculaceae bacterium]